jgi:hypothetical protein
MVKLVAKNFSPASCNLLSLKSKQFPQLPVQLIGMRSSTPLQDNDKRYRLHVLNFALLERRRENITSQTEWQQTLQGLNPILRAS